MEQITMICPCHFGLESVLSGEVKRLGGQNVTVTDGRVAFDGDLELLVRANLWLRTAERVLIRLGEFHATSFEQLFQGVKKLPLEQWIGAHDAFPVKGHSLNSQLHSIPDCQSIIKKAAVERLKECYHVHWFEENEAVHQIQFSILKDVVTVMLDTSGPGLHKRGYRQNSNAAPIKETLASGIIDLAHVKPFSTVYDPFCGSGTFLIESATKALNIAPGINRRFAAEKWKQIPQKVWQEERTRALDLVRRDVEFRGYGLDIDPAAVELSTANAKKAGVLPRLKFNQREIADFSPVTDKGIVICNPPYGERMLEIRQAEEIYRTMGKVFQMGNGIHYYIISPHEQFETIFGKKADKRRKLYNGMLKCQLYMYFK
ncbi:THUMP domain-containing class I SAM-dependent RNA methyltransferase [Massilioclostridium coli]|uniref:THUMP domain-containing class I SAM-dependent RNA methyltransferase n=1 Tax=Massilioclostridium coli TaxID=1870991 RepID=UPI000A565572